MIQIEHLVPDRRQLAERGSRPRIDRQRIGAHGLRPLILQQYVALAHLDEGIAALGQHEADIGLRPLDPRGLDRVADLERQVGADQIGGHCRLRLYRDRGQAIEPPRRRGQHDLQTSRLPVGGGFALQGRDGGGVIIAQRLHQTNRQLLVLARPRRNLGRIGSLALALTQRRQPLELIVQVQLGEPAHIHVIADVGGTLALDISGGLERGRLEAAQRRQRLGKLRVLGRDRTDRLARRERLGRLRTRQGRGGLGNRNGR